MFEVHPGFIKRDQRRRAIEPLFNTPEEVKQNRDHRLLPQVHQVLALECEEATRAEHVMIGIQQMTHRTGKRVILQCLANLAVLNASQQLRECSWRVRLWELDTIQEGIQL